MRPPDSSQFARSDRIRRLEKTLVQLDVEVMQAIYHGRQSASWENQEKADFLAQRLEQVCEELGAKNIVRLQDEPNLAQASENVLDTLEMILEEENLSSFDRLVKAWRFLCRPEPQIH